MTVRGRLKPEDIRKQVESLLSEKFVAPDYLRLFQEIFEAQYRTEKKLRVSDLCPPLSKAVVLKRLGDGLSAIDEEKLRFAKSELLKLLERFTEILENPTVNEKTAARKLLDAANAGGVSLPELAKAAVRQDGGVLSAVAQKLSVGEDEVYFLARILVQPFLRVCARSVRRYVDLEEVQMGVCPICGGAPFVARLRADDGRRILSCCLCGTEWTFQRLKCPFCGNEEEGTLGFFFTGEDAAYRVDKCDVCHRYIKTVDERKKESLKELSLDVLDAATLYLDLLAEKEGYHGLTD